MTKTAERERKPPVIGEAARVVVVSSSALGGAVDDWRGLGASTRLIGRGPLEALGQTSANNACLIGVIVDRRSVLLTTTIPRSATSCGRPGSPGTTGASREVMFDFFASSQGLPRVVVGLALQELLECRGKTRFSSSCIFPRPATSCGRSGPPGTTGVPREGAFFFLCFPKPATSCGWLDSPGTTGAPRETLVLVLSLHPPRVNRDLRDGSTCPELWARSRSFRE